MADEGVVERILDGQGSQQDRFRLQQVDPTKYTCIHIGRSDLCAFADRHVRAPYRLDDVGPTTPCPECKHRGTLRPV